ncbi:MAG: LytTR family DNA-binding domain-containing protein [Deltaproteobacteria bacterium]|nr:LytTR family DNA-binding domain-containing protein [Deltaproteobacteria bacterium]
MMVKKTSEHFRDMSMKLRCVIVDDEIPSCDELSHLLGEREDVEVVGCAHGGREAVACIKELEPDVVFLDIKMPDMNGFDVAREMITVQHPPSIVFATAYDEYAIEAFEVRAADYILKPFSRERLEETVQRLKESRTARLNPPDLRDIIDGLENRFSEKRFIRISVIEKGKILLVSPTEIFFCSAIEGKSKIFTKSGSYFCPMTLNELEDRLKKEHFFRAHRSHLVNLDHIREVVPWIDGKYLISMGDNRCTEIPVSRSSVKHLKTILRF